MEGNIVYDNGIVEKLILTENFELLFTENKTMRIVHLNLFNSIIEIKKFKGVFDFGDLELSSLTIEGIVTKKANICLYSPLNGIITLEVIFQSMKVDILNNVSST